LIRALRRRHLAIWIALALLLPILLITAIRARRTLPLQELPASLVPDSLPADDAVGASTR
jgi:hypothetical protein